MSLNVRCENSCIQSVASCQNIHFGLKEAQRQPLERRSGFYHDQITECERPPTGTPSSPPTLPVLGGLWASEYTHSRQTRPLDCRPTSISS
uniref:Uncharacterized protein n=1 Tax=Gasterosteus aculeatus TaxID=69293 RepID=G3Q805_GASAC